MMMANPYRYRLNLCRSLRLMLNLVYHLTLFFQNQHDTCYHTKGDYSFLGDSIRMLDIRSVFFATILVDHTSP